MTEFDALTDWVATLVVASLTWAAGVGVALQPGQQESALAAPIVAEAPVMLGWAQSTDGSDIEQVGEEPLSDGDVEELDSGTPPVDSGSVEGAAEVGSTVGPVADEDVELLDQGAPPASGQTLPTSAATTYTTDSATALAPAPVADAAASYSVPETSAPVGPVLPEGFGEGSVHVSAGRGGFPPGLEECEVGAVTGRAFVGINCGDGRDDVVGHAPSFEDFPFVLEDTFPFDPDSPLLTEANFPFDDNSGFFGANSSTSSERDGDTTNVLVTAGGANGPSIGNTGGNSGSGVRMAQRSREGASGARDSGGGKKRNASSAAGNDNGGDSSVSYQSAKSKNKKEKSKKDDTSAEGKKSRDKDRAKAKSEKKQQKAKGKKNSKGKGKRERRGDRDQG